VKGSIAQQGNQTRIQPLINLAAFAGEHLFYEAQTFIYARKALKSAGLQSQKNVLIESCSLHLRNLVDFFYQSNAKADDVIAADYVADWDKKCPAISSLLEKARTRANKEVAHLTTKRIAGSPQEKSWDFDAVSAELRPAIAKFVEVVDRVKVPERTISELQQI
jgi:hypothetical protein